MAVSRLHTWIAGEVLLASDLNSEFNNILTNGTAVAFPATAAVSLGGFALNFDAANTIAFTATTSGISLTGGTVREPSEDTLTAFATGGQSNATALSAAKKYHRISVCATAADSAKLPTSTAGQAHYIRNDGVASAQVFGTSPDTINTVATGTGVALPPGTGSWFVCTTAGNWTTTVLGGIPLSTVTTKGDLIVATASATVTRQSAGSDGAVLMADSKQTNGVRYIAALTKMIYGLTYSNNGSDATNDLDIAAGGAMDATGAYWVTLAAAITKQSDVSWAVGSGNGGLDTGSVGNSDYYIWLIARSDTGVVDVLYSLSSTAPTMPTNYDFKRLIGWFKRVGATIVAFHTVETECGGLFMKWDTPTLDVNQLNSLTTSRRTDAVKVPLNFSVLAQLRVQMFDATAGFQAILCDPNEADAAPGLAGAPLANFTLGAAGRDYRDIWVYTSAAGLIAARSNLATVDEYDVVTLGFRWARRN